MCDWNGTGLSVMELSHRSHEFSMISEKAKNDLREFLQIPLHYKIFFFQGGASMQYGAIIKNLLKTDANGKTWSANYLNTGLWSNQCLNEAKHMMPVPPVEMASGAASNFTQIEEPSKWKVD